VIATGSKPAVPPIPGLSEVAYWTTHDAIQADPLPESLIILGGGAVGCELGQVFSRFGVKVTIVEGRNRILPLEEPEASDIVAAVLEKEGATLITGVMVEKLSGQGDQIEVITADGAHHFAEKLLVATGRSVDLSELGLETAGLDSSIRFIAVDDRCRAAEGIWAMGDVTGKAMFTHTAVYQSAIVAADLLNKEPPGADYETLPRVTFTDPEVGSVGLTEATARERGIDVDVVVKSLPASFRGWLHGPGNDGVIKLIIDRAEGVLVGATSVGPHGGEVLGLLSVAMHERVPLERLRHMIYPYPTFHGAIGEALGAYGRGIGTVLDPGFQPLE
jgi:pyruvate/2-oxoglutarate dehydrogenase complex dihydrolipoamide dehydrogenase (E3) component